MSREELVPRAVDVRAENIGGIDSTQVTFEPDVTVLTGRNATNRTSLLQAVMAALGSEQSSLKADAEEGFVELTIGDETYSRRLVRTGENGVTFEGDPFLEDPEVADLFAFLLENNEARQAVERGEDLREVIMRPIDTTEIERRINELETEKRELDSEIDRLETLANERPELEAERDDLEDELAEKREELEDLEAELDELDVDPDESRSRKAELEAVFSNLRDARSELEDVEFELETERASVAELESERDDLQERLDESEDADEHPEKLDGRIEELRERKRALDETVSELQSVIAFNEEMLEDQSVVDGVLDDVADGTDGQVTDELLAGESTTCWTCGSDVETGRIESTLERLRDLRSEKLSERNDLRDRIDDLTDERSQLREQQRERERAQSRLDRIETELETADERIEELETERDDRREQVAELEAEVESFDETDHTETLERHREANRLELEIGRLEDDLDSLDSQIADRENATDEREELLERRAELTDELADLRNRVDRIEADAVESFNEHMESLLDILEYDNIDRIWIDRREESVREGRRTVERSVFDLHIVRSTDGTAYRDSVENLSESEREVTGLVFALAGYLVHDVHEDLPFVLLDSLEAIDSDRIAAVVEYFQEYADYLVVALLPEDAQALPDDCSYVTEI